MNITDRETDATRALAALGHDRRLAVFRLLVRAGPAGASVGTIAERTGIPASTLNHHLGALADAGLIEREREGRTIRCRAAFARMNALIEFLTENCCGGLD